MRGSIPLSSAKLNKMRDIKKEMSMVKGGDFLEWYDSLDAVEKAQYKVEFNKLQEWYASPTSQFNEILDEHRDLFVRDLVQGRIEQAINIVVEDIKDDLYELINEVMIDCDLISWGDDGDITEEVNDNHYKIYKGVLRKLYTDAIHGKPDNLNTTEAG